MPFYVEPVEKKSLIELILIPVSPETAYSESFKSLTSGEEFTVSNDEERAQMLGYFIYAHINTMSTNAPRITQMIIDLPISKVSKEVNTLEGLSK
jgi:hypothetical protein